MCTLLILSNNNNDNNNVAIFNFHLVTHSAYTVIVKAHHFLDSVLCWDKTCHNHEISVNGRKGTSPISPSKPLLHLLNVPHYEFILSFIESNKLIWHKFLCKALEMFISKVEFGPVCSACHRQMLKCRFKYQRWTCLWNGSDLANVFFFTYFSPLSLRLKHLHTQAPLGPLAPPCLLRDPSRPWSLWLAEFCGQVEVLRAVGGADGRVRDGRSSVGYRERRPGVRFVWEKRLERQDFVQGLECELESGRHFCVWKFKNTQIKVENKQSDYKRKQCCNPEITACSISVQRVFPVRTRHFPISRVISHNTTLLVFF